MFLIGEYQTDRDALIQGLQMIADSLTHLTISDCQRTSLHDILETCPNLVSLTASEVDTGLPSLTSSCYPKMTHLELVYTPDPDLLHDDQTIDFISGFPSLLSLEIYPMDHSKLLTIIHKLCPSLQILYYGGRKEDVPKVDVQPNREGLMLVHLCGSVFLQHDVIQFFYLHQKTLEEIYCNTYFMEHEDAPWGLSNGRVIRRGNQRRKRASLTCQDDPTQSEISFERLLKFEFASIDPTRSETFSTWFISNAPNLKSINVIDTYLPSNVANAMINSKNLSKLNVTSWKKKNLDGIKQFLERHIAMGNHSTLEEMEIQALKGIPEITWLPLVPRLMCLKSLKLRAGGIPQDCVSIMAEISQGCPALEKLWIASWCADFPQGILKPLCQLTNLKWLRIEAESICESDLVSLTTFPSLKELYLYCKLPNPFRGMLCRHMPKVVIK